MISLKYLTLFFSIFYLIAPFQCYNHNNEENGIKHAAVTSKPPHNKSDKSHVTTIWIHGTRLIKHFMPQEHYYSPSGIKHIDDIPPHYHMYKIAQKLSSLDPNFLQKHNFYLFGWSGELCYKARKKAGNQLCKALNALSQKYYSEHNIMHSFRILTHSHGGNVALNLAYESTKFTVSKLILLACPVQEWTKKAIECPLFERVYSFFSRCDLLQIIDPQGMYKENKTGPLLSKRLFSQNPKLIQVEIKIYGRSLLHIEFRLGHFLYKLPVTLKTLKENDRKNRLQENRYDYTIIDIKKPDKIRKNVIKKSSLSKLKKFASSIKNKILQIKDTLLNPLKNSFHSLNYRMRVNSCPR